MRNRAKCRLCNDIIESKHQHDYVSCSCEEIALDGGNAYHRACFKNKENFIVIDDEGNEVIPVYKPPEEISDVSSPPQKTRPSKQELLVELDIMIKNLEQLPAPALHTPVNHADFCSMLILLHAILKSE